MIELPYKTANPQQLNLELQKLGLPGFIGVSSQMGNYLRIKCDDSITLAQEQAVRDVVAIHVPKPPEPIPDPDAELWTAIEAAGNFAELKAALLGKARAGKVKGQTV